METIELTIDSKVDRFITFNTQQIVCIVEDGKSGKTMVCTTKGDWVVEESYTAVFQML